jgi:hypothetical protein
MAAIAAKHGELERLARLAHETVGHSYVAPDYAERWRDIREPTREELTAAMRVRYGPRPALEDHE